ncbi:MAG: oxidoreductase [Acidobacteria bacterium RBG_16_68_9]|nr:MAG: oxidoreductase [Acidobacteria bacterium RBG_16_68_9]
MDIRDLRGRTVLVTGAASGIGKETALAFARRSADLVICDVNEDGLAKTEDLVRGLGRRVVARRVDVARREEMKEFAAAVHREVEAVDILVNNAGVGLGGGLLDTELEDWDWIVGINIYGVIHGCHFFVPAMVTRGRGGHVVNVSSAAGLSASAILVAYSATKFAVLGLSEAIREELRPHGIGVTAICPGIINTPITETAPMRGPDATPETRRYMVEMYRRRGYGPERVAANILKAIERGRTVAPVSPEAWFIYFLKRLSPSAVSLLHRRINERMRRETRRGGAEEGRA